MKSHRRQQLADSFRRLTFLRTGCGDEDQDAEDERILRKMEHEIQMHRQRRSDYIPRQLKASNLRCTIETLLNWEEEARRNRRFVSRKDGLQLVLRRFGMGAGLLSRIWNTVKDSFSTDLADLCTDNSLTPEEVFLMTLQDLRTAVPMAKLALDWGLYASQVSHYLNVSVPILRSRITSTDAWPPVLDFDQAVDAPRLERAVLGSIDCRFQFRNRHHPGQREQYRSDKKGHGMCIQLLCSTQGM